MADFKSVAVGFGVILAVLVTLALWMGNAGSFELGEIFVTAGVLAIAAAATYVVLKRRKDIKDGFSPDDELTKKAGWKAGYFAYIASVWTAVGMMWLNIFLTEAFGFPEFSTGQFVAAIVLIPGFVFLALALYFRGKGNVE
jgi:hypothetical protein